MMRAQWSGLLAGCLLLGCIVPPHSTANRHPTSKVGPCGDLDACNAGCSAGDSRACTRLGHLYKLGKMVAKDEVRASLLFERACAAGDQNGCTDLSSQLFNGVGSAQDTARAFKLAEAACRHGNQRGCNLLGQYYELGRGVPQDFGKALSLYQSSCEHGWAHGCAGVGWVYSEGKGVPRDLVRAASYYDRACRAEDGYGCGFLGTMYLWGRGLPKDEPKGWGLIEHACQLGQMNYCLLVGHRALVDHEQSTAFGLYRRACEGDVAVACYLAGGLSKRGEGGGKDTARFYERGCKLGYQAACSAEP